MRHVAKRILAGAFVLAATLPAFAQDEGADTELYPADTAAAVDKAARVIGREGVKSIRLFGSLGLDGVYRSSGFDRLFFRDGTAPAPAPANYATQFPAFAGSRQQNGQEEAFLNAVLTLGVEIEVNDSLSGYFRLESGPSDAYGAEAHRVGSDSNFARFREGYATVRATALGISDDTFDAYLRVGIQNVRLENRRFPVGEGNPFMLDIMNSENPFTGSPALPAAANGTASATGIPGAASTSYYQTTFRGNTFMGGNAWINNYVGQPREQEAGGVVLGVRLIKDSQAALNIDAEAGLLTILETGVARGDTEVAYFNMDFSFGKPNLDRDLPDHHSKVSLLAVGFSQHHLNGGYVGSVGGGLNLFLADNLVEIFGEGQYQGGIFLNPTVASGARPTRHESYGGYGGIRLQMPWNKYKFYIEASGWFLMGDDGSVTTNGRPAKNKDFMSLENNNQTIIVEGSMAGLDIDSNYFAIKAETGITLVDVVDVKLVGGVFQLINPPNAQAGGHEWGATVAPFRVNGAAALANYEFDDNLGIEVDVRVTWRPGAGFSLYAAYGTLFGSDFLKDVFDVSSMTAGALGAAIQF